MNKLTINLGGWPLFITALLCVLKLAGVLTISWWWCFCLLWLPFAILLGACVIILVFIIVITLIKIFYDK